VRLTAVERRYGIVPAAEAARLRGRELLQGMIEGRFPAPPITEPLSFWLIEVGEGTAVFEGEAGGHLLNPTPWASCTAAGP
jgi:hypothetical protein